MTLTPDEEARMEADRDLNKSFYSLRLIPQTIPTPAGPEGTVRLSANGALYISTGSAWVFLTPGAAGLVDHAASHLSDGGDAIAAATNTVRGTVLVANNDESVAGKVVLSADTRLLDSAAQKTDLTDAGDTALHFHATDRDRANHTGTQILTTISDVTIAVADLNALDDAVNTALHFHDADRDRANHTGTQVKATISDFAHAATHITGGNDVIADAVAGVSSGLLTGVEKAALVRNFNTTATAATPYEVLITDRYLLISGTDSQAKSVVLLNPVTAGEGFDVVVKDVATASVNNITVTTAAGLIDGGANSIINTNLGKVHFLSDGTNWHIIG